MNSQLVRSSASKTSVFREVISIFTLCVFAGVVSGIVLGAFVMLLSSTAHASQPDSELTLVRMNETPQGSLLFKQVEQRGMYASAPTLKTSVSMHITGMLARVRVEQQFSNPTQQWQEGIYVFPLPDDSAVDTLRMQIGERIIEGRIKEKAEARGIKARNAKPKILLPNMLNQVTLKWVVFNEVVL